MDPETTPQDFVTNFVIKSFRLTAEKWQSGSVHEDNSVTLNGFFEGRPKSCLFICEERCLKPATEAPPPDDGHPPPPPEPPAFYFTLSFPKDVASKVLCLIKDTADSMTSAELHGNNALNLIVVFTEDIALPLISNQDWPEGKLKKALKQIEILRIQACVVKSQTQGGMSLPLPGLQRRTWCRDIGDSSSPARSDPRQASEWTIIKWGEIVEEFLKEDLSELLQHARPLPQDEFNFWQSRLRNLISIDIHLRTTKTEAAAAETALRRISGKVQSALTEAQEITNHLKPLQEVIESLEAVDYALLWDKAEVVMAEARSLWTRSQVYSKPHRIVVLLQEICNLFIKLSRAFLGRSRVLKRLLEDPAPGLELVRLCIKTLERLKECYMGYTTRQNTQGAAMWDFPSLLIFDNLNKFLAQLRKIREVYIVTLDMSHLKKEYFSGINFKKWTQPVLGLYSDFLHQVTALAESNCDATDSDNQEFPELWAHFHSQVQDIENGLVIFFSLALETCTFSTHAGKIVSMFGPVFMRPLILKKLRGPLNSVWNMIQREVDYIALLAKNQIQSFKSSQLKPSEVSILTWVQKMLKMVQDAEQNKRIVQTVEPSGAQLVSEKCKNVTKTLLGFRAAVRIQWTERLEKDCTFILQQPVIQLQQSDVLEVPCGSKLKALLDELWLVDQDKEVKLHLKTSQVFSRREDLTETHLSLRTLQSTYNEMVSSVKPVERPLIQAQLQDANRNLSGLQGWIWETAGLLQEVQIQRDRVLSFHLMITEARTKTAAIKHMAERWGRIQLLQRQEDGLLKGKVSEGSQSQLSGDAKEVVKLTQEIMNLYRTRETSEAWLPYLDHIDDLVLAGLVQLLQTALSFLTESMKSPELPLLRMALVLQPRGCHFMAPDLTESGGVKFVEKSLQAIVSELYKASDFLPRISPRRDRSYQPSLKQSPALVALEQKVRSYTAEVSKKAEHLRAELDHKYNRLWTRNQQEAMSEFLKYGQQLGPDKQDLKEAAPTLKEFKLEIRKLEEIRNELSAIKDPKLQGWLEVNLQSFRDSVMSLTKEWSHIFIDHLLKTASDILKKVAQEIEDQPESSFPLTETLLFLEKNGVDLLTALPAQIHC